MKKQIIALLLASVLLLSLMPAGLARSAPEDEHADEPGYMSIEELMGINMDDYPKTMYVYTENGGVLNVRQEPMLGNNVIGQLEYGAQVTVEGPVIMYPDWSCITYYKAEKGYAYVMTRYLVSSRPTDIQKRAEQRAAQAEQKKNQEEQNKTLEELNRQLASAKMLEKPLLLTVRASRASGWGNLRVGPSASTNRVDSLPDGRELKAVGETDKWYQAIDMETGKTGYISKNFVNVLGAVSEPAVQSKENLGKLNINGEFTLECKLPEGYQLQVVNMRGTKIVASILSGDKEKPMLYLTVAYNEMYANVERMNDLTEEDLQRIEESYAESNEVEISYRNTAYGTKLLIAKEVGSDTDFVDIFSVYKGYEIEFVMTPNPEGKTQTLSENQIQMCVDFLSDLDFVPAK